MDILLTDGEYTLSDRGMPVEIEGLAAHLQKIRFLLTIKQGTYPYDRSFGSKLHTLDFDEPQAAERAAATAGEAVHRLASTQIIQARITTSQLIFTVVTPFGEGEITLPRQIAAGSS